MSCKVAMKVDVKQYVNVFFRGIIERFKYMHTVCFLAIAEETILTR